MRLARLLVAPALLSALFAIGSNTPTAYGADYTVDSEADDVDAAPGDGTCATSEGVCTLRAAIMEANQLDGADTISVPAGTYELSQPLPLGGGGPIDSDATGDLDITQDLTITGAGREATIIDAHDVDRVVEVKPATQGTSVTVSLNALTLQNGDTGQTRDGGGLKVEGVLTALNVRLTDVRVTDNYARHGGGIFVQDQATLTLVRGVLVDNNDALVDGGGLSVNSDSVIQITDSSIVENDADSAGGIMNVDSGGGTVQLTRVVVSHNDAATFGGGIFNGAAMTIRDSTIDSNEAAEDGGGGIYSASDLPLVISGSSITNNTAGGDNEGGGGLQQDAEGTISVTNSTIAENHSGTVGGAVLVQDTGPLTFTNVTIANNTGDGGVYFRGDGELHVQNVILVDNGNNNCKREGGDGTITSAAMNMSSDPSCQFGGISHRGDLAVEQLANNGGPTQTMELFLPSPAITGGGGCPSKDQRGAPRPPEDCSLGAVQMGLVLVQFGDNLCNGNTGGTDALQAALGLADATLLESGANCAPPGGNVELNGAAAKWADVNCSGLLDADDISRILRVLAGLVVTAIGGCPTIGDPVWLLD